VEAAILDEFREISGSVVCSRQSKIVSAQPNPKCGVSLRTANFEGLGGSLIESIPQWNG
jgi:hypothetical protein